MALDVGKKRGETRDLTVEFEGDTIQLTVRPRACPVSFYEELQGAEGAASVRLLAQMLCKMVASWDVLDNGQPVPLEEAVLMEWPGDVLSGLANAVAEGMRLGEPSASA